LPSQRTTDPHQPEFVEGELEYSAEEIVAERTVQVGQGRRREFLDQIDRLPRAYVDASNKP
jgi:hypothetical protein